MIDLHCHSTASDGLRPPAAVVRMAAQVGLRSIALTDHDTTAGIAEAQAEGERTGVEIIPACEFSVAAPWGEMHLLAYFIPPGDAAIQSFLDRARTLRAQRARDMVSRLNGLGIRIDGDAVVRESGGGAIGRPHIARVLERQGQVQSVQQAFDRYIGRGRPAFVDKQLPLFTHVAQLVHAAGGVVSAAHLKSFGTMDQLARLQREGLDAVETRHPSHNADHVASITNAALQLGLARTGGSDWHGEPDGSGSHAMLGSQQVPDQWLELLRSRRPLP